MAVSVGEVVSAAVERSLGKSLDVGTTTLLWGEDFEDESPLENSTTSSPPGTSMYFLSSGAGDEFLEGPEDMLATSIGLSTLLQLMLYVTVGALFGAVVVFVAETIAGAGRKGYFGESLLGTVAKALTWGEACLRKYLERIGCAWRVFEGKTPSHSNRMDDDLEACLAPSKVDRALHDCTMDGRPTTSRPCRVVFDLEQNQVCEYVPGTWGIRIISSRHPRRESTRSKSTTTTTRIKTAKLEEAIATAERISTVTREAGRSNTTSRDTNPILVKNSRRRRRYSSESSRRRYYNNTQRLRQMNWGEEFPCGSDENDYVGHEIV